MNLQFLIAGCAVSIACAGLILVLLRPLTRTSGSPLTVRPEDLGGSSSAGLILSSVLGLYLELLLIRWISSEIRIFAYFKNFVLIACFLGFGLGCYLTRRTISVLMLGVPLLFFSAAIGGVGGREGSLTCAILRNRFGMANKQTQRSVNS